MTALILESLDNQLLDIHVAMLLRVSPILQWPADKVVRRDVEDTFWTSLGKMLQDRKAFRTPAGTNADRQRQRRRPRRRVLRRPQQIAGGRGGEGGGGEGGGGGKGERDCVRATLVDIHRQDDAAVPEVH
jgi:hypothetical protein